LTRWKNLPKLDRKTANIRDDGDVSWQGLPRRSNSELITSFLHPLAIELLSEPSEMKKPVAHIWNYTQGYSYFNSSRFFLASTSFSGGKM